MSMLKSATDIIDALGGNTAVAELTSTTHKAVSNWRAFNKFPPNTYLVIQAALIAMDKEAPDHLWSMRTLPRAKKRCA